MIFFLFFVIVYSDHVRNVVLNEARRHPLSVKFSSSRQSLALIPEGTLDIQYCGREKCQLSPQK